MLLLLGFAFIAGVVTVLSPCILPVLPIVLSSSATQDTKRPYGVVIGFVASFTFFTLFLTTLVRLIGISPDALRLVSVVVLLAFGATLVVPKFQVIFERLFALLSGKAPNQATATGLFGGVLIGFSLGLLWTPCVGPILAAVISLALTGTVTSAAAAITLAYATGTAIPMLIIMRGGQELLRRHQWLLRHTPHIQRAFGVVMMVTAVGIVFNVDRRFQTWVLTTFPQYGVGLTQFEDTTAVQEQLRRINAIPSRTSDMRGKPSFEMLDDLGMAPELILGGEWLNSEPLTLSSLRGKVVLVDFWTYSCINCIRTLPYLRSWHEKYADKGLVIIGVHTPEFEFEKNVVNVRQAVADFGLLYPVMQDNNYETWRAYDNHYWPAKYLIDANGRIRYTHFGEGAYDETERVIQSFLSEAGAETSDMPIANPDYQIYSRTPETYLGYLRMDGLASPEDVSRDTEASYSAPAFLPPNTFALGGSWLVTPEYATAAPTSELKLNFQAKEVFLVMRSADGQPHQVTIELDGQAVEASTAGDDVKLPGGLVTVEKDRLYRLIKLEEAGRHTLRLVFPEGNIEAFAFTFG